MVPAAAEGEDLERAWSSTPWTGGTSAPPPTGTSPTGSRTRSRPKPPRAAPRPGSPSTRQRAPVVEQIFTWRVVRQARHARPSPPGSTPTRPATPPPPGKGWTAQTVSRSWATPSTPGTWSTAGIRNRNGRRVTVPPSEWLWSPEPVHPAIVDRDTWDAAQQIGAEHGTSRDGDELSRHPAATRTYAYRGRFRCRDCRRRMAASRLRRGRRDPTSTTSARTTPPTPGTPPPPRTTPAPSRPPRPGWTRSSACSSPTTSSAPAAPQLLAAQLPATDAAAARRPRRRRRRHPGPAQADRDRPELLHPRTRAAPRRPGRHRRRRACAAGSAPGSPTCTPNASSSTPSSPPWPPPPPAPPTPPCSTSSPLAGDILPGLPPDLKARLFEAFDIQILWNKPGRQATVHAEITDATLQALPAILNPGQDGYDDTSEQPADDLAAGEDLFETPIVHRIHPEARIHPGKVKILAPADRITMRVRRERPLGPGRKVGGLSPSNFGLVPAASSSTQQAPGGRVSAAVAVDAPSPRRNPARNAWLTAQPGWAPAPRAAGTGSCAGRPGWVRPARARSRTAPASRRPG